MALSPQKPAAKPRDNNESRDAARTRGVAAEAQAERYLVAQGLRVVARNFRVKGGEIDLICRDGTHIVFVEVRARASNAFGDAAASITPTKQRRLILAARHWLTQHGEHACRFDAVLVDGTQPPRLTWLRDVISAD